MHETKEDIYRDGVYTHSQSSDNNIGHDPSAKKFQGTIEITEQDDVAENAPIDGFVNDPFVPFDDLPDEPQNILTV